MRARLGVPVSPLAARSFRSSRVGPAPHLGPIELGERLNLLTGDNGLGKSFLLDVTWWALTIDPVPFAKRGDVVLGGSDRFWPRWVVKTGRS